MYQQIQLQLPQYWFLAMLSLAKAHCGFHADFQGELDIRLRSPGQFHGKKNAKICEDVTEMMGNAWGFRSLSNINKMMEVWRFIVENGWFMEVYSGKFGGLEVWTFP